MIGRIAIFNWITENIQHSALGHHGFTRLPTAYGCFNWTYIKGK